MSPKNRYFSFQEYVCTVGVKEKCNENVMKCNESTLENGNPFPLPTFAQIDEKNLCAT